MIKREDQMFKKAIALIILFLNVNSGLQARTLTDRSIDRFITNQGVSACNGESQNCKDFYTRAVELNDYRSPISPEITF